MRRRQSLVCGRICHRYNSSINQFRTVSLSFLFFFFSLSLSFSPSFSLILLANTIAFSMMLLFALSHTFTPVNSHRMYPAATKDDFTDAEHAHTYLSYVLRPYAVFDFSLCQYVLPTENVWPDVCHRTDKLPYRITLE